MNNRSNQENLTKVFQSLENDEYSDEEKIDFFIQGASIAIIYEMKLLDTEFEDCMEDILGHLQQVMKSAAYSWIKQTSN